jgi:hypothetical protein
MKLRWYLAVLVLAGVVPLILLTVVVTVGLVRQQRAAVERGLSDAVAALTSATENELETSIKSLETLATSRRLDADDLPSFYEQAARVRLLSSLHDDRSDRQRGPSSVEPGAPARRVAPRSPRPRVLDNPGVYDAARLTGTAS